MIKHVFAGGVTFGAGVVLGVVVGTLYGSALERLPRPVTV